jgi:hypothetical protein
MNDKTVITQNTPHKVTVAEGSSHASRPSVKRGQGGGPSVIETPSDRLTAPVLEEAARAFKEFDKAAGNEPMGDVDFGTQDPFASGYPVSEPPADPDRALLDDWRLSAELIERIDELRTHNARINTQIDQLSKPSKKARV